MSLDPSKDIKSVNPIKPFRLVRCFRLKIHWDSECHSGADGFFGNVIDETISVKMARNNEYKSIRTIERVINHCIFRHVKASRLALKDIAPFDDTMKRPHCLDSFGSMISNDVSNNHKYTLMQIGIAAFDGLDCNLVRTYCSMWKDNPVCVVTYKLTECF